MIKLSYRPEIDGLRAIAVLSVILYHIEFFFLDLKVLTGGFIGVDIFFVISGYLITSIIIKEINLNNKFSLLNFYERRIRRIFPALFITISISTVFAWLYLIPSSFLEFTKSIIASVLFISNYFFYFEGLIYNNDQSLLKPLLHTWSLSVEEQFYIFFPVLLIIINKFFKRNLLISFIIIFIISFFLSFYTTTHNANFSFFSTLSRVWEFLAGSLIAYYQIKNKKKYFDYHNLFTIFGLFLIFYSIIFFNEKTLHPSVNTLIPILGTCLIIFYSDKKNYVTKFLSNFLFIKIGLISYSLYLWHFPVFAIARNKENILSNFDKLELIIITVLLSLLSYIFVEKPFRNKNFISFKLVSFILSIFLVFFIILNTLSVKNNGFEDRLHVFLKIYEREKLEYSLKDENGICFDRIENFCNFNKSSSDTIIMIGDSHSAVLTKKLYKETLKQNVNFIPISQGTCVYLPKYKKVITKSKQEFRNCSLKSKNLIENIIKDKSEAIIILSGNFKDHFYKNNRWSYLNESNLEPLEGFIKSIEKLLKNNNKVILLYPVPTPGFHVVRKLMSHVPKKEFNVNNFLLNNPLTFEMKDYYLKNQKIIDAFDDLKHKNLRKIISEKAFCNRNTKICKTHHGSKVYYRDENHLTVDGVEILSKNILLEINSFLD